jgi:hypothetical protein
MASQVRLIGVLREVENARSRIADPAIALSRQLSSVSAGMVSVGSAAADPKPGELSVGTTVEIHSLLRAPESNGVRGEIVGPPSHDPGTGRWSVKIEKEGRLVALRSSNLRLASNLRLVSTPSLHGAAKKVMAMQGVVRQMPNAVLELHSKSFQVCHSTTHACAHTHNLTPQGRRLGWRALPRAQCLRVCVCVCVQVPSMFQDPSQSFGANLGSDDDFVGGIQGKLGMGLEYVKDMYLEHNCMHDAETEFTAYNAGHVLKTTARREWAFVVGSHGVDLVKWSFDLQHAEPAGSGGRHGGGPKCHAAARVDAAALGEKGWAACCGSRRHTSLYWPPL